MGSRLAVFSVFFSESQRIVMLRLFLRVPKIPRILLLATLITMVWKAISVNGEVDPARFEEAIAAFEQQDAEQMPPQDAILFVGSSSIRKWDTAKWFPDRTVINRGFGGSHMSDLIHFTKRVVLPYRPRTIVLYEGDNDLAGGKSPGRVHADYVQFVRMIRTELPETKIVFIAIKPSLSRWKLIAKIREANQLIKKVTDDDPLLDYVDVDGPMLNDQGMPRPELFADDGLHLNDTGYELWTKLVEEKLAD